MKYKFRFKALDEAISPAIRYKIEHTVTEFYEKYYGIQMGSKDFTNHRTDDNKTIFEIAVRNQEYEIELDFNRMQVRQDVETVHQGSRSRGAKRFTWGELRLFDELGFELHPGFATLTVQKIDDWFKTITVEDMIKRAAYYKLTFTPEALKDLQSNIVDYIREQNWTVEDWFITMVVRQRGEDVSELFEKTGNYNKYF